MQILKKMLKQDAVVWLFDKLDDDSEPTFQDPIEIKCRWEEMSELYLDENSREEVVSKAKVYVDRRVPKKSRIKLGNLNSIDSVDPYDNEDTFEVMSYNEIPTLNAKKSLKYVFL